MKKAHLCRMTYGPGWRLWLPREDATWLLTDYKTWAEALAALDAWLGQQS